MSESAALTPELVEEMKQRLEEFGVQPMICSECGRSYFALEWLDRPEFKTTNIMFITNERELEAISCANMTELRCEIHRKYEGREQ